MSQRAVFFISSLGGLALFAAIAHMQLDSRAFTNRTHPELEPTFHLEIPVRPLDPPTVVILPDDPTVVTLPPLEVRGIPNAHPRQPARAVSNPADAPHEATVPCSEWRDIGPRRVNEGSPSGAIKVRNLC